VNRPQLVRWHNCPRTHKTFLSFARCVWPEARFLPGNGPYATVRGCGGVTVLLHPTLERAEHALQHMHPHPTDGRCDSGHVLALLVLPEDGAS
jgi:hypothetical protein